MKNGAPHHEERLPKRHKVAERFLTVILTIFFTGAFLSISMAILQWLGVRWR